MPLTIDELHYRTQSKIKYNFLSLDPGETTGWSYWEYKNGLHLKKAGHLDTSEIPNFVDFFYHMVDTERFKHMVVEDYRVYGHKLEQHSWNPVYTARLIGAIEAMAFMEGVKIKYYMASTAKGFCTDAKLREWKLYIPNRHARDSVRHACYYYLFGDKEKL